MTTPLTAAALALPPGYPDPSDGTGNRRLLDRIVSGAEPPPRCVTRLALPRPSSWSSGRLTGVVTPGDEVTWAPRVVFGGWLGCLADQYAGLVMLSVLPDGVDFVTSDLTLDFLAPTRPGEAVVTAEIVRLTGRAAGIDVTLRQSDRITCRASVRQLMPGTAHPAERTAGGWI